MKLLKKIFDNHHPCTNQPPILPQTNGKQKAYSVDQSSLPVTSPSSLTSLDDRLKTVEGDLLKTVNAADKAQAYLRGITALPVTDKVGNGFRTVGVDV